ncbi:thioredoxin [Catovirus CTV1]|uniref:Thioredoxin n=1 Tax=Catovirus CTV1 TaxID=1977631 RepID=A0A1V0SAT9_9VIRU|nr:thioredoxin [Catovirus CTV1]
MPSKDSFREYKSTREFLELLDIETTKNKLVVIDFYAPWCGPCKKLGEFLNKLLESEQAKTLYSNVIFVKINVDNENCKELVVDKFNVSSIPRVIMIINKLTVEDITGFNPKELVNLLNKHSKKN